MHKKSRYPDLHRSSYKHIGSFSMRQLKAISPYPAVLTCCTFLSHTKDMGTTLVRFTHAMEMLKQKGERDSPALGCQAP